MIHFNSPPELWLFRKAKRSEHNLTYNYINDLKKLYRKVFSGYNPAGEFSGNVKLRQEKSNKSSTHASFTSTV